MDPILWGPLAKVELVEGGGIRLASVASSDGQYPLMISDGRRPGPVQEAGYLDIPPLIPA